MAPRTASTSANSANLTTAYSLALLSEYTHTLDSLPLDLSRHFADLRELDAVLSSSMHSITARIQTLTTQIEEGSASKEERLWLLTQIAEEASRLKLGGEDKIRVACLAGDNLKSHSTHLRTLLEHIPGFDVTMLNRRTTYPHVSAKSYLSAPPTETGRRRRTGFSQLLGASAPEPSPKKRKVARDEDIDLGQTRSPRKEKPFDGAARARNTNRTKKLERAPSPAESMISVTSHIPNTNNNAHALSSRAGASGSLTRAANGLSASNKRARASGAGSNGVRTSTPQSAYDTHEVGSAYDHPHGHASSSQGRREVYNMPSSSSHPSLPLPYSNSNGGHYDSRSVLNSAPSNGYNGVRVGREWSPLHLPATQLEGPGMPVSRAPSHPAMSLATTAALGISGMEVHTPPPPGRSAAVSRNVSGVPSGMDGTPGDGGDGDGDGDADDRRYCICDGPSYGNMIGCDDTGCEKEWFHLTCMGLTSAPVGTWYCDECKAKRNKRTNRGGKRRPNRAGGKTANGGV